MCTYTRIYTHVRVFRRTHADALTFTSASWHGVKLCFFHVAFQLEIIPSWSHLGPFTGRSKFTRYLCVFHCRLSILTKKVYSIAAMIVGPTSMCDMENRVTLITLTRYTSHNERCTQRSKTQNVDAKPSAAGMHKQGHDECIRWKPC